MKPNKNVQRNTINEANVKVSEVSKSGFSLGYSSQLSGSIGKLLPISVQWVMPNDRIKGGNTLKAQFEPLAVPMTGRLDLDSHNFYVKMRNIYGQDWMDFMSPSQGVADIESLPTFTIKSLFNGDDTPFGGFPYVPNYSATSWNIFKDNVELWLQNDISGLTDFSTADWIFEYSKAVRDVISSLTPPSTLAEYKDAVKVVLYALSDKLLGEGSYLDFFGYPILDHRAINKLVDGVTSSTSFVWSDVVSDVPLSDAPIRAMGYIWYAYYRNIYTEPKKNISWNPRKWTTSALPLSTLASLLVPRFRNWNIDMFTGAQIDDISRHVYAGIPQEGKSWYYLDNSDSYSPADSGNDAEMQAEGIVSQQLQYIDSDGQTKTINVKVPSIFGSAFSTREHEGEWSQVIGDFSNLPLLQLRRAKMLERYLKRVFYLGSDLYTDYTKAIYGVDLSDALANQPIYLRGSNTPCDVSQEVNNTTTNEMPAGAKTAVMAVDAAGDGYEHFCDEFGLVIQVISFLPECSYDGMPNQLLYSKLMDFPIPQFSQQDDELSHRFELSRTILASEQEDAFRPFAHHPYKHDWRSRVNDFHGNALSTRKMYNFGRLFDYSNSDTEPKMNAAFLHCKPNLDMFISNNPLNDFWFGYADHQFYVERALSAYVEEI